MFRGINQINLDAKGRLALPAKYRERLIEGCEGNLVVTIDPTNSVKEPCLLLYPLSEWEAIQTKIDALSSFNPASRKVQRLLVGHADDVVMDASGRILLSAALREFGHMDKRVVLIGQGKKFEIWDEATWNTSRQAWLDEAVNETESLPAELDSLSL
ncbi:MAG: division/cell wall cluster transcriptional repressor MraZ [Gammaproteobacteria bacterium]|nr:division/cell wall cluster transcriptional repressor MraZ [Gammaproteobacteria bacterium]